MTAKTLDRAELDRAMTEADWMGQVVQWARLRGWFVFHARAAQSSRGWRTPVQYDGAGFPDLCLVRPGEPPVWAELKSERGHLTPEQTRWVERLRQAEARVHVWRPSDWPRVEETLR